MILFLRTPQYGAITRHFIREKQGRGYNGVSMNGDKPEQSNGGFGLFVRSPVENSGMRQDDLISGGVRIVIILEVFRMDRWTIYNDPV